MAKTVIGLYNSSVEAERVIEDLIENGFERRNLGVHASAGGSLDNSLRDLGVPASDANDYVDGVRQGGTLVTAHVSEARVDEAVAIMDRYDRVEPGERVDTGAVRDRDVATQEVRDGDETIEVVEERMDVGKRAVERGGVRVRSYVTEQPVEEQVTLRDETVHVDRHKVDRPASDADFDTFKEGTIEVTEHDEEAVVTKEARVVEEVVVGKEVEQRTETVRDTVRRTDVEIEEIGVDRSRDEDYSRYDDAFRKHYETVDYRDDYTYEEATPAYRYGYTLAHDPRYEGRDWNEVEPDARRSWEERNEGTWDRFQDSVRHAYNEARGRR